MAARSKAKGEYRFGQDDVLMNGAAPAGIHVDGFAKAIADDAEQKAHLFQRFTVARSVIHTGRLKVFVVSDGLRVCSQFISWQSFGSKTRLPR